MLFDLMMAFSLLLGVLTLVVMAIESSRKESE